MKKLLMLGTSLGSTDIVRKAQEMGCHVIVTDDLDPKLSKAKLIADECWMISTADVDALEARCRQEGVDGVFAGVSEFNLDHAFELCDRLGLPRYSTPEGWSVARDKGRFLDLCRKMGVPTARQYAPDPTVMDAACAERAGAGLTEATRTAVEAALADVRFPVMVKPVDCCGNLGISFCNDADEVVRAWQLVRQVSSQPRVVVEQRLMGVEYSIVYALTGGEARMFRFGAVYNEPGYPTNLYDFGTTIAPGYEAYMGDTDAAVRRLLRAVGCREGIAWIQAIRGQDGVFRLFEMGYRLTADMAFNKMISMTGFDAITWLLELQMGMGHDEGQLPCPPAHEPRESSNVYCMFAAGEGTIDRVEGTELIDGSLVDDPDARPGQDEDHISVDLIARPGMEVRPGRLLGKLTFHAWSAEGVAATMRRINRQFGIVDEAGNDMLVRFSRYDDLVAVAAQEQAGRG